MGKAASTSVCAKGLKEGLPVAKGLLSKNLPKPDELEKERQCLKDCFVADLAQCKPLCPTSLHLSFFHSTDFGLLIGSPLLKP